MTLWNFRDALDHICTFGRCPLPIDCCMASHFGITSAAHLQLPELIDQVDGVGFLILSFRSWCTWSRRFSIQLRSNSQEPYPALCTAGSPLMLSAKGRLVWTSPKSLSLEAWQSPSSLWPARHKTMLVTASTHVCRTHASIYIYACIFIYSMQANWILTVHQSNILERGSGLALEIALSVSESWVVVKMSRQRHCFTKASSSSAWSKQLS